MERLSKLRWNWERQNILNIFFKAFPENNLADIGKKKGAEK